LAQDNDWIGRLRLKYGSELRRLLERKVRVRAVAEELEQDTYVKLQRLSEHDIRHPRALLFHTAGNIATRYLQRVQKEQSLIEYDSAEDVADTAVTPSRAAELDEAIGHVNAIVAKMPRGLQEVWLLHVVEDLPYEQIAQSLDISVKAVDKRLERAKTRVRRRLSDLGLDDRVRS
jgi:RNA polymerase sigma factor (sigma-70 family)